MTHKNSKQNNKSLLNENDKVNGWIDEQEGLVASKLIGTDYTFKHTLVWENAIVFMILHVMALWGLYLFVTGSILFKTYIWSILVTIFSSEGVTIGAHRLFAHKSFKAKPLLKAILIAAQTISGQNCVFRWCRDHRLHHRYSDTDGDPHNSKRGFFFCHIGWLMTKKHPYVKTLGKRIDMSDLEADWMVMFQKKYFYYLYFIAAILIPVGVPYYFFGESFKNSILVCYFFRYIFQLNGTWLVNSAAHLYGTRPYDQDLQPVESWFVSWLSLGEGWHNYHHSFPWDYKAAELSKRFNASARFIKYFEKIGLAYDLKSASEEMVTKRIKNKGDGTHYKLGNENAKNAVTAFGILHPLNPTYNVVYRPPDAVLEAKGLPLYHEKDVIDFNVLKRDVAVS